MADPGKPAVPDADCALCPRLSEFRSRNRADHGEWFNGPVPSFGPASARLLIVGLAPGLRGANRTGRPFTGDYAGDLLYQTLKKFDFSDGGYDRRPDDGLGLVDCRITNAVRCVPPENKPIGAEIAACRPFLQSEIAAMPNLALILSLGAVSHSAVLGALGLRKILYPFGHASFHDLPGGPGLADSYHCSRYNTNTGRLTTDMFEAVFRAIRTRLDG